MKKYPTSLVIISVSINILSMQLKSQCASTPIRVAIKTNNTICWKGRGTTRMLTYHGWECVMVQLLGENGLAFSHKTEKTTKLPKSWVY